MAASPAKVRQAYRNIGLALQAAGANYNDLVKTTTYLVGEANLEAFAQARSAVLAELYPDGSLPPNTLLLVARLANPHLLVAIDAVAVISASEVSDA